MATESIRMAGASQLSLNSLTKRTQAVPEAAGDNSQGQTNSAAAQARAEPSTTVTITAPLRVAFLLGSAGYLGLLVVDAREQLAGYKLPKSVDFQEVLPRNPSGKVQRFKLKGRAD
mgnify:CR=1 FL=1